MTAPTLIKRTLTINFQRSISSATQKPEEVEVVLVPLSDPSSNSDNATLVGGPQRQRVLLSQANNPVRFDVVPSDNPNLDARVIYRLAYRIGQFTGVTKSQDFAMPDLDCDWDSIVSGDLGEVIGKEVYLQQTDRGTRVAALDLNGYVLDGNGNRVTGSGDAAIVQGNLDQEVLQRKAADAQIRTDVQIFAAEQVAATLAAVEARLVTVISQINNGDLIERTARQNAVNALNSTIATLNTTLTDQINAVNGQITAINGTLDQKVPIVDGKIPSMYIPDIALGTAVPVANQTEMLALTPAQVQPGDFAIRPDGVFILMQFPINQLSSWTKFTGAGAVFSVNNKTGAVVLSASDVGARPVDVNLNINEITNLQTALDAKASTSALGTVQSSVTALENRVNVIEGPTYVRLVSGLIPKTLHAADVAFVNNEGKVVDKSGNPVEVTATGAVISVNGLDGEVVLDADAVGARSASVDVPLNQVAGLQVALDAKVATSDFRLTNPRAPLAHADSHATGGSDPITPASIGARPVGGPITIDEVTGLQTALDSKGSATTQTSHGNRINSLETRVDDLESGSPGGGGGGGPKVLRWDGLSPTGDFSTVQLDSPFGYNPANANANTDGFYYDPTGAADGEGAQPYLHASGYLEIRRRNLAASPDPAKALASDLAATNTAVAGKASQADMTSVQNALTTKASVTSVNDLTAVVATKADTSTVNGLADEIATKTPQTQHDALQLEVDGKAEQTDLAALTTTVNSKASQTDLTSVTGRVGTLEGQMPAKANLTAGRVPLSETNNAIPISYVSGLQTALDSKPTLVGGKVPKTQVANLDISQINSLQGTLDGKADLVGGKLVSSQLPALATQEVQVVTNRAAMLALTSAQVQQGDLAVITATNDQGTYILSTSDPSQFENWVRLQTPADAVSSVNGQTGTIILSAADIGAIATGTIFPISQVSGLQTALDNKASTTALTSGLAGKTSPADVTTILGESGLLKGTARLVATSAVASLSGLQSIDGVLTSAGDVVLLTAQSSSVQNGLWVVASGAWARTADMAATKSFVKNTGVWIAAGTNHANTFWQETANSGTVGTNANNWTKTFSFPVPSYTAVNGVQRNGNEFSAKVVTNGGVLATTGGLQIDSSVVAKKFSQDVPAGSTVVTITHNLGTRDVHVFVYEVASGIRCELGFQVTGLNTVSLEFGVAPVTGQYRAVVIG